MTDLHLTRRSDGKISSGWERGAAFNVKNNATRGSPNRKEPAGSGKISPGKKGGSTPIVRGRPKTGQLSAGKLAEIWNKGSGLRCSNNSLIDKGVVEGEKKSTLQDSE